MYVYIYIIQMGSASHQLLETTFGSPAQRLVPFLPLVPLVPLQRALGTTSATQLVSWDDDIPNMMGTMKPCSKLPTSHFAGIYIILYNPLLEKI